MNSANALFVEVKRNDNSKRVGFENSFCNIVDGGTISTGQSLSVINPATGKQLAAVPDVDRTWLHKAIGVARNAFASWSATPFGSRKKPGRFGIASTLFEILSFRLVRMRTQVLVWRLARRAAYFLSNLLRKRLGTNCGDSVKSPGQVS